MTRRGGERWRDSRAATAVARRRIHRIQQAKRQFGVVTFLVGRMGQLLHVQVGEHTQQRGPHIDPATQSEMGEIVEA